VASDWPGSSPPLAARVLLADAARPAILFARYNAWPWRSRVQARCVDWQKDHLGRRFDVILGADILYDSGDWHHLDAFWRAHLAPQGCVLLGEPGRHGADRWLDWITARGWRGEVTSVVVESRPKPIRVFRLWIESAEQENDE
jgi:hypothetical protein